MNSSMGSKIAMFMAMASLGSRGDCYHYSSHNTWKKDFKGAIDQHKKNLNKRRKHKNVKGR